MDLSNMTQSELQKKLDSAKKRVSDEVRILKEYEREIERRLLKGYWDAHPELTPINVHEGDDLLTIRAHTTSELMPGSTVTVTSIYIAANGQLVHAVDCYNGMTAYLWNTDEVGKMREAYLKENPDEDNVEN